MIQKQQGHKHSRSISNLTLKPRLLNSSLLNTDQDSFRKTSVEEHDDIYIEPDIPTITN